MKETILLAPITASIAFVASLLTGSIRRSAIGQSLAMIRNGPIGLNLTLCTVLSLLAGIVVPLAYPEVPRDPLTWLGVAGSAAASGVWTHNRFIKDKEPEP